MSKTRQAFLFIAVALSALAAGLYFNPATRQPPQGTAVTPAGFMSVSLATPEGGKGSLAAWKGKVMVVNFWATWCAPCRKEIPDFVRMQQRLGAQGLQFVGVAVDELDAVRPFLQTLGVNYPNLVGQLDALELARSLGNEMGALPFTVVVDRSGRVVQTVLGATTEARLEAIVLPLL
jgi:thiol-disulfide isomerase/thioredoxin